MSRTHLKATQRPDIRTDTEFSSHVSNLPTMVESRGEQAAPTLALECDG